MDEVSHAGTGGCLESWRVWVQPDSVVQLALVVALGGLRKEASWKSPSTEAVFHENCDLSTFFQMAFKETGFPFFFFFWSSSWESNLSCRELPNLIPVVQTLLCFGVLLVHTAFGDHHSDLLLPKSEVFNSFLLACFNIYYLFTYFRLSSLLCTGLWQAGATLLPSTGFSLCCLVEHRLKGAQASVAAACGLRRFNSQALELGLNRCGLVAPWHVGSFWIRNAGEPVSCIDRWILYHWATREAQFLPV